MLIYLLPLLMIIGFRQSDVLKKPLSSIEEKKYLEEYKNNGSKEAKDILVERNLRLVANIAKKYIGGKTELCDLLSIGTIGLIKGINTFKIERNNKLSTYASRCIENEILMYLRHIKKFNDDLYLQECVRKENGTGELLILDTLKSNDKEIDELIIDKINFKHLKKIFNKVLTYEEQYILKKRYGVFGEKKVTQNEIAVELNISRSYVSRIETRALSKLRKELS